MRRPLLLLAATLISLTAMPITQAAEAERPNVVMICIDDLNDWVGCLDGHPDVQTPHIDALARRGRNFANAHCAVPVCSPSRVSIMSGLHATTHGSYQLGPSYQSIDRLDDVPCMQEYFQQHGYTTMAGGKVLHHGFGGRLAAAIDIDLGRRRGGPRPKQQYNWHVPVWDWGPYPETDQQMFDYQLAEAAAEQLKKEHDAPFFISVGFFRPHVPMFVPPKWFDMYEPESITMPRVPADDMEDVPPNFQGMEMIAPTYDEIVDAGKWRSLVRAYLACTSFVDMCVGTVLEALEESPHRDNTIVVLWSDHGFHLGEKHHIAKRMLWEESTRTPLIFAGPGIEAGADCNQPASLVDVYPTLVELCGLSESEHLEGVSLVPQLKDPAAQRKTPAITSSFFGNHTIRTQRWRYIRYADGAEELYDHRRDPGEYTNLASDPEYGDVKRRLRKWLPEKAAPEVMKGK